MSPRAGTGMMTLTEAAAGEMSVPASVVAPQGKSLAKFISADRWLMTFSPRRRYSASPEARRNRDYDAPAQAAPAPASTTQDSARY